MTTRTTYTGALLCFAPLAFGLALPANADCIDSDPPALAVMSIDANNSCSDINGYGGCFINDGIGSCSFSSGGKSFTVDSTQAADGRVLWSVREGSDLGVKVMVANGGAQGKNNCSYTYAFDTFSGQAGDLKPNGSIQNITGAFFCTDGSFAAPPPPPPVAENLPLCQDPISQPDVGFLDETGIRCPAPDPATGLVPPVVVCNLEKDKPDWGATDGSGLCCQCGIPEGTQTSCFVTPDSPECTREMTVDPTQAVELMFFRADGDPCTWKRTSRGWEQICW